MNKEQIKLAMIMTNSTVKMVSTVDSTEQLWNCVSTFDTVSGL